MEEKEVKTGDKISIVVPCYNEEDVLSTFYHEVHKIMIEKLREIDFEIIFIDDGSKDTTAAIIKELNEKDKHVEFISFSRNFGKESAIYAGLRFADGDYTVIMDADLQHPPEVILQMYEEMKSGRYDMIATRRKNRSTDTKFRAVGAKLFYKVMNKISGIDMGNNAMDFRMLNRKAKNAILSMGEYNRFSKGIFE
ncbi:MAG: glycosyltransferase family 2 protein, partial [Lachnospiraceae bacterium]|nr:glycosyltransferase family 2 protein [Lachnospiraceae bacterium]